MDIRNYIELFLVYCKTRKNVNPKTLKAYAIDLEQFAEFCNDEFSKDVLCRYIEELNARYKPKTIRRKIAVLKAFAHYLIVDEYLDRNPFERLDLSLREPVTLPKTIPL